jgi:hypothetical protein
LTQNRNQRENIEFKRRRSAYENARYHIRRFDEIIFDEQMALLKLRKEEFEEIERQWTLEQFDAVYQADLQVLDWLLKKDYPLYKKHQSGHRPNARDKAKYTIWAEKLAQVKLQVYGSNPPEQPDHPRPAGVINGHYPLNEALRSWHRNVYDSILERNNNPFIPSNGRQTRPAVPKKKQQNTTTNSRKTSRRIAKLLAEHERIDDLEKGLKRQNGLSK